MDPWAIKHILRKPWTHTSARGASSLCTPSPTAWHRSLSGRGKPQLQSSSRPTASQETAEGLLLFFGLSWRSKAEYVYLSYLRKETYGKCYAIFSTILLSYNYNALHKAKSYRKSIGLKRRQFLIRKCFPFLSKFYKSHLSSHWYKKKRWAKGLCLESTTHPEHYVAFRE